MGKTWLCPTTHAERTANASLSSQATSMLLEEWGKPLTQRAIFAFRKEGEIFPSNQTYTLWLSSRFPIQKSIPPLLQWGDQSISRGNTHILFHLEHPCSAWSPATTTCGEVVSSQKKSLLLLVNAFFQQSFAMLQLDASLFLHGLHTFCRETHFLHEKVIFTFRVNPVALEVKCQHIRSSKHYDFLSLIMQEFLLSKCNSKTSFHLQINPNYSFLLTSIRKCLLISPYLPLTTAHGDA